MYSEGSYGTVFCAKWKEIAMELALKDVKSLLETSKDFDTLIAEATIMRQLRHENVNLFYGILIVGNDVNDEAKYLATQYCSNGDLQHYMLTKPLKFSRKLDILIGIVKGMMYLHVKGIVHRYFI